MEWLRQMLGLPEEFTGVIQDTASTATLVALLSARERATPAARRGGTACGAGPRLTVYASQRGALVGGQGRQARGLRPGAAAARSRSTTAFAHATRRRWTAAIARRSRRRARAGVRRGDHRDHLLHRDRPGAGHRGGLPAARRLAARGCRLRRRRGDRARSCAGSSTGVELADSFVFNPHKWMLVNFDCTAYFVRDRTRCSRPSALTPEYLRTAHDAEVVNFRDWGIQLGRRFRALKLWFVIRSYGVEGLRAIIRQHMRAGPASWPAGSRRIPTSS